MVTQSLTSATVLFLPVLTRSRSSAHLQWLRWFLLKDTMQPSCHLHTMSGDEHLLSPRLHLEHIARRYLFDQSTLLLPTRPLALGPNFSNRPSDNGRTSNGL